MKKALLVLLATAGCCFGAVIEQDSMELGLQGELRFRNERSDIGINLMSSYGYFFADNIQAGGLLGFFHDGRDYAVRPGGFIELNFDIYSPLMPYVAARAALNLGTAYDVPRERHYVLGESAAGMKFFISPTLAISSELYFTLANKDVFPYKDDGRKHDAGIRLGLRHLF